MDESLSAARAIGFTNLFGVVVSFVGEGAGCCLTGFNRFCQSKEC